jgi:hypothetical protein
MPEQSSWSCYGDCGSGYANSITSTGSTPSASLSALMGGLPRFSSQGINDFADASNNAVANSPSQYNDSVDTLQGSATFTPPGVSCGTSCEVSVCGNCASTGQIQPVGLLPGVSSWTIIGNIAHYAVWAALVHANPNLFTTLASEFHSPKGGPPLDLAMPDSSVAFEIKPDWYQFGSFYSQALTDFTADLGQAGFGAGSWSDLGIPANTVSAIGTFTGWGGTFNGSITVGYDLRSYTSGMLFYAVSGYFQFTPGVPIKANASYFP